MSRRKLWMPPSVPKLAGRFNCWNDRILPASAANRYLVVAAGRLVGSLGSTKDRVSPCPSVRQVVGAGATD